MIPQSFIDTLLDRVDIVELVDARVKLKKAGKNYSARCPFHEEKTPSFTVSQDKQFYYCFGCGASGNAIGFLMDYERLGFPEAVEQLANLLGVPVPREERSLSPEQQARERDRKTIYDLLEQASDYFRGQLRQHPSREKAVGYLKNRGLSGTIARDFGIGYAPPGWDNLLQALGHDVEAQRLLIESGMLINRDDSHKLYDRFRDRIMFPIRDIRGRVIGFGGRVLNNDKPKYLNSPESPVFHKGEELYGLYEARQANKQLTRLLVVEGYMDVVALAQFGISYGVATLGTACREDHLLKAFKCTQEVVFCFDGDKAGRSAARRALEASLPIMSDGRQVKFLFLPEGEDPDTLVRQVGPEKFEHLIANSVPLENFFFDALSEQIDIRSMEGRARLSKLAAPLLNLLPKGVYRELMFQQLAKRTGLEVSTLLDLVQEVPLKSLVEREELISPVTVDDGAAPPEDYQQTYEAEAPQPLRREPRRARPSQIRLPTPRLLTLLLLHNPQLAQEVTELDSIRDIEDPSLGLFMELIELLRQRPHFTTGQIIGHIQGTHGMEGVQPLNELAEQQARLMGLGKQPPNYDPAQEFRDGLQRLARQAQQRRAVQQLAALSSKPFNELSDEEKQQYRELISQSGGGASR